MTQHTFVWMSEERQMHAAMIAQFINAGLRNCQNVGNRAGAADMRGANGIMKELIS